MVHPGEAMIKHLLVSTNVGPRGDEGAPNLVPRLLIADLIELG